MSPGKDPATLARWLKVKYPIFGFNHSIDVTVEVCRAGGIGVFGATRLTPSEIRETLSEIRSRVGKRPFGVDLVLPKGMPSRDDRAAIERAIPPGHRRFVDDIYERYDIAAPDGPGSRSRFVRSEEMAASQLESVLSSDVDLLAMGIGSPQGAVSDAKKQGKTVISLIGSPHHALAALESGADILVAQGYDAGAHTGQIGTFSLVPQIVDIAGDVPVVAAGGVATGRHIVAAMAMGAQGVWMGTAWLLTQENHTDPIIIKKLLEAGSGDAVISRADSGKTLRQIRTEWTEIWDQPEAPRPLRMPYQDILVGDLLGAIQQQRIEPLMHSPAGQSIGYFHAETTVAELFKRIVAEAEDTYRRLSLWEELPSDAGRPR